MVEFFSRSKKSILLNFFGFVLSIGFLQAQEMKTIAAIEKIYLHTDRTSYFIGEDLWYKAYDVRAYNNFLFDNSNILYVELISPDSKIVARNKTNLELGLGYGDFQLSDSIVKPGHYQLRAYTNWNRNFSDDFVFKKDIEIINVVEQNSASYSAQLRDIAVVINALTSGAKSTSRVDFFPEGGSLLENVASVIGFKAVDGNGKPIEVTGQVFDSNDELITSFASTHDGMGKFQIIPIEGKQYYVKTITKTGAELRNDLPKATKQGYLLSYRLLKGRNIITISTNSATLAQNPNAVLTLVCKGKGISYLESNQTLTETTLSFELPKDKTPEGISQITLFDGNSRPQSERLVYIEKEHDLDVVLATDKASYKPQEKVFINVSSKSKTGVAKSASFSLSVTDMNGEEEDKDFDTNISSYFLMESDIRGKVNNPAYYFDSNNLKRLEDLDNLLLTQGWRDFLWKTTLFPIINQSVDYVAEKGITITGKVKQLLGSKPLVDTNLTLGLMNKKNFNIFNAVTDSSGVFKFKNLMFSGKTKMYLNTRNEKGKFKGEIILKPIEKPVLPVTFESESFGFSDATNRVIDNVFKKNTAFGVNSANVLKDVKVITQKEYKNRTSIVGIPEFTYVADTSAAHFPDIYQLIQNVIPGTVLNFNGDRFSVRFFRYRWEPVFVIDGFIEGTDRLDFIQPADVLKIEAIRGPQSGQYYGSESGVIAITTNGNKQKVKVFHTIRKEIDGFYAGRVFYVPNPSKPNPELDNNAAVRNTIYWNPYLNPDKTGNASVSYFNSNVETKVKVALEGITASGIPVVKKAYYIIKK